MIFLSVGDPVALGIGGNWGKAFPADDGGWHMLNAAADEYHYNRLDADLVADHSLRRTLTDRGELIDHSVTACPDGTWAHAASATHLAHDDTIYLYRYDEDWNAFVDVPVREDDTTARYVDSPVVCSSWLTAIAYRTETPYAPFRMVLVDEAGSEIGDVELPDAPEATGSSLWADDDRLFTIGSVPALRERMRVAEYDTDLALVQSWELTAVDEGSTAYWFQRAERVNDTWIVAHMVTRDDIDWIAQTGDVYLTAFDDDWRVVDQVAVTAVAPPDGAFHPWVSFDGERLLVVYSLQAQNYALYVDIDVSATVAPPEPEDTGAGVDTGAPTDTGAPADTGEPGGDSRPYMVPATGGGEGCGCENGASGALLLPLTFVVRRRRLGHAKVQCRPSSACRRSGCVCRGR